MKTTKELLDMARARCTPPTYYRLAQVLGIQTSNMTAFTKGRRVLSDDLAIKVADLIKWDRGVVVTMAHAEKALRLEQRDVYRVLQQMVRKVAVVGTFAVLTAAGALLPTPQAHAVALSGALCIM